jgi:outer membrane protein OmpA-like peptidoglycan-associated protein
MNRAILIISLLVFPLFLVAQETDERFDCATSQNAKAIKLYNKGIDKKVKKLERMPYLQQAMKLDPFYIAANCEYGLQLERTFNYSKSSKEPCARYLKVVVDKCPEYHSAPYYILAQIYDVKGEYNLAVEYYQKFLNFKSDYEEAFSRTYEKDRVAARENLGWAKFYAKHYGREVAFDPQVVKGVSTKGNQEYLPLITPDGEHMYFTRRMEVIASVKDGVVEQAEKPHIERFCVSEFNPENGFDEGVWMTDPFNNDPTANYGGATMSIDNKHLYMTVCKPSGTAADPNYVNCDIYGSNYTYAEGEWFWGPLENLGPNVNTDDGWESQPTLSADGKTLYFTTFRKTTRGLDIYYSTKGADGEWSPAKTIGDHINTEYNDKTPFVHSDSHTLYFSSEGHYGFGGFDVFYARADDNGVWQDPENMGFPINTEGNEHGFIVSTDGERVYFASNNIEGKSLGGYDVFSFELYEEARPEHVVFLKGTLKDEHNQPIKGASVEMKNTKTDAVTSFDVDAVDGSFTAIVTVKEGEDVVLKVKAEDKVFTTQLFDSDEILAKRRAEEKAIEDHWNELVKASKPKEKLNETDNGAVAVKFTPMTEEEMVRDKAPSKMNTKTTNELVSNKNTVFAPVVRNLAIYESIEIKMEPIEVNKPFKLNDIHYATNSAHLTEKSNFVLNEFIAFLKENESMIIVIHGHTDNQGDEHHNLTLSTDRAYSVMVYLQEKGIDKERMSFKGFGQEKPLVPNSTVENRVKNRRTEFVILSK